MIDKSGEQFGPFEGILVGVSWFMTVRVELCNALITSAPRLAALPSRVEHRSPPHYEDVLNVAEYEVEIRCVPPWASGCSPIH